MKIKSQSKPIKEIIASEWKEIQLYKIKPEDEPELSTNPSLRKISYNFEEGKKFIEHSHETPQLLLVKEGKLTHYDTKGNEYVQHPYDILIVPAHFPHSASTEEELIVDVFHKKAD